MSATPANWYPDPTNRHELRYWDGTAWTDHVSDNGVASTDPVNPVAPKSGFDRVEQRLTIGNEGDKEKIAKQLNDQGRWGAGDLTAAAFEGGGSVFNEPILVVNQKAKVFELTNQYGVFDRNGNQLAWVNQVGQSSAKKMLRLVSSLDQFLTHKLEITDPAGAVLLRLTRPAKVVKSSVIVSDAYDREIGRIVQNNVFGKIRFALQAGEHTYGEIKAENWRAWNFRVEDHTGTEVARITKTFEGIAKTMFTTADNYVVHVHTRLAAPLDSLVVAAALSIDTALKQDDRGLN
jgi:uncharacterized protein YxjI